MSKEDQIWYYLELQVASSRVEATVNGFPYVQKRVPFSTSFQSPVNTALIGEGNAVRITVRPTVRDDGTPTTLDDMQVIARIKRYGPSDEYSTPEGGKILATMNLKDTLKQRREALQEQFNEKLEAASPQEKADLMEKQAEMLTPTPPITMEVTFGSKDVPSFANLFVEGTVIEDTTRLIDYALKLKNIIKGRETDQFYEEHKNKDQDYMVSYPNEDLSREEFRDWMSDIYESGPIIDFDEDDIGVRRWTDGRIWEVYVKDGTPYGRPFLQTRGDEHGDVYFLEVYVAEVDGELAIIR